MERERNIPLQLYVTSNEFELVKAKMAQLGTSNFSAYARKMLIDGMIINVDYSVLKGVLGELSAIGKNINQIAKRTNETRSFHASDMAAMKALYNELKTNLLSQVTKHIKYGRGVGYGHRKNPCHKVDPK